MRSSLAPALFIVLVLLSTSMFAGQWPRRTAADVPRLADDSLDYDALPPRTADGRPDLSGLWYLGRPDLGIALPPASAPPVANGSNIGLGWGGPPLTPWGEAELSRFLTGGCLGGVRVETTPVIPGERAFAARMHAREGDPGDARAGFRIL